MSGLEERERALLLAVLLDALRGWDDDCGNRMLALPPGPWATGPVGRLPSHRLLGATSLVSARELAGLASGVES